MRTFNPISGIQIAPYQEQDHEAVCKLLVSSFQQKFYSLAHLNDDDLAELLIAIWPKDSLGSSGIQVVAKEQGIVVGTICLKWRSSRPAAQTKENIRFVQLFKQYGYLNVCKFLTGLYFLDYRTQASECYIDHLAVHLSHRSKGIGKQLLSWAQNFAGSHSEFHHLSLHVAGRNQRAVQLYEQMTFGTEKSKYNAMRHFLFKEPVWHYMTWRAATTAWEREQ